MALQNWYVKQVDRQAITKFIQDWHYSGSINGCISDYCYALYSPDDKMKGAMFFGRMAMANQWKRFGQKAEDVIELRRLCCVNDTPKNAESYFIGRALRLLQAAWEGKVVVSYADAEYNHTGVIYKASNFQYLGFKAGSKVIIHGEKRYHDKSIRAKYKGKLKPFAVRLKKLLEVGEAYYKQTKGKHTYI